MKNQIEKLHRYSLMVLSVIFIFTAFSKLLNSTQLFQFLFHFLKNPTITTGIIYCIILFELIIGLGLNLTKTSPWFSFSIYASSIFLLGGISIDIISIIYNLELYCGCFGYLFEPSSVVQAIFLKLVIFVLAIIVIVTRIKLRSPKLTSI